MNGRSADGLFTNMPIDSNVLPPAASVAPQYLSDARTELLDA